MTIHLRNRNGLEDTPAWFHHLLPLKPQDGQAQVSNGWLQAGRIVVRAHLGYAYSSLWQGALQTVFWLVVIGLSAGLLGVLDIRKLRRELQTVVAQAHAISEQRFMRIAIPGIPELAEVGMAMNHMVERLQNYLLGLRDEVDRLRREVLTDSSTGLPNREAFEQRFASLLDPQADPASGHLLLIRVAGLAELNQRLGGRRTDALLKRVADDLSTQCQHSAAGWPPACAVPTSPCSARNWGRTTPANWPMSSACYGRCTGRWIFPISPALAISASRPSRAATSWARC
jgi:hypothetical protein